MMLIAPHIDPTLFRHCVILVVGYSGLRLNCNNNNSNNNSVLSYHGPKYILYWSVITIQDPRTSYYFDIHAGGVHPNHSDFPLLTTCVRNLRPIHPLSSRLIFTYKPMPILYVPTSQYRGIMLRVILLLRK